MLRAAPAAAAERQKGLRVAGKFGWQKGRDGDDSEIRISSPAPQEHSDTVRGSASEKKALGRPYSSLSVLNGGFIRNMGIEFLVGSVAIGRVVVV